MHHNTSITCAGARWQIQSTLKYLLACCWGSVRGHLMGPSLAEVRTETVEVIRRLKFELQELEKQHEVAETALISEASYLPNITHPDVVEGDEDQVVTVKTVGYGNSRDL